MSRYIDAELVPKLFDAEYKETRKLIKQGETHLDNLAEGFSEAAKVIRTMPTADVVEVRHGEWQFDGVGFVCSECGEYALCAKGLQVHSKFCHHCGAKMDGERRADDEPSKSM